METVISPILSAVNAKILKRNNLPMSMRTNYAVGLVAMCSAELSKRFIPHNFGLG
jgi:hypothetical protein